MFTKNILSALVIYVVLNAWNIFFSTPALSDTVRFEFGFSAGLEGWTGGFADYPVGREDYDLNWEWSALPEGLQGRGIYITGNNHSDDLFMFVKRRIEGLKPNTRYQLVFDVRVATNESKGCAGIGGAPGEGVVVKVGATTAEPVALTNDGEYRMNVDKGNQAVGGKDAVVIGDIANATTSCDRLQYEIKQLGNQSNPLGVTTDDKGRAWLLVGTDSGFEGTTSLYYVNIKVSAREGEASTIYLPVISSQ